MSHLPVISPSLHGRLIICSRMSVRKTRAMSLRVMIPWSDHLRAPFIWVLCEMKYAVIQLL